MSCDHSLVQRRKKLSPGTEKTRRTLDFQLIGDLPHDELPFMFPRYVWMKRRTKMHKDTDNFLNCR
jgi:hypothetical protein